MVFPVYHFFRVIIVLQDERLAPYTHVVWDALYCRYSQLCSYSTTGDNVHLSKPSQAGNPSYNIFLLGDMRQWGPFVDLWDPWVVRMPTEKTPCPLALFSTSRGSRASKGFSASNYNSDWERKQTAVGLTLSIITNLKLDSQLKLKPITLSSIKASSLLPLFAHTLLGAAATEIISPAQVRGVSKAGKNQLKWGRTGPPARKLCVWKTVEEIYAIK